MPVAGAAQPQQTEVEGEGKSPEPGDAQKQTAEIMGAPSSESVVVTFGRFNPPTTGHEKLLKSASAEAERSKSDFRVFKPVDSEKSTTPG